MKDYPRAKVQIEGLKSENLVLQGKIPFRTSQFKHILKLVARQILARVWMLALEWSGLQRGGNNCFPKVVKGFSGSSNAYCPGLAKSFVAIMVATD